MKKINSPGLVASYVDIGCFGKNLLGEMEIASLEEFMAYVYKKKCKV